MSKSLERAPALMIFDDFVYLFLLLLSILFGSLVRSLKDVKKQQLLSTALGFILMLILSGHHIIHPLILTVINAFIVLYVNKRVCHVISFIFCFTYLMFLRTSEYFGIPSPSEFTNTFLMIMTLKMVGLAYEVNIHHLQQTEKVIHEENFLKEKYQKLSVTFLDVIQYSFCYAGILIGPYFKYRTYWDLFHTSYSTHHIPYFEFLMKRFSVVPLYIGLYLVGDYLFPLSFASSEEILQLPFLYRVFYMTPWFFTFRMRIYTGLVLGECVCINLGLGAYPELSVPQPGAGPTNHFALQNIENNSKMWSSIKFNFETVRSMDEQASEFRSTIREGIRYWNMTVQYWLAIYIYRQTSASKPVKMLLTMFVSAIWHGVRPGYYLSLLGTPLLLLSEIEVEKAFRKDASPVQKQIFDKIWYFVKMQSVAYMGMAFILLDISDILHYWKSIYFIGHLFTFVMFCVAFLKNKMAKRNFEEMGNVSLDKKAVKQS